MAAASALLVASFFALAVAASRSTRRTNLPLNRGRLSASFFLQSYLTLWFHTRCLRFRWNLAILARRSSTVYAPIRCSLSLAPSPLSWSSLSAALLPRRRLADVADAPSSLSWSPLPVMCLGRTAVARDVANEAAMES